MSDWNDRDLLKLRALVHKYGAASVIDRASSVPQPKRRGRKATYEGNYPAIWAIVQFHVERTGCDITEACRQLDQDRKDVVVGRTPTSRRLYYEALGAFERDSRLKTMGENILAFLRSGLPFATEGAVSVPATLK